LYVNDLIIQQIIQRCLKTSSKQWSRSLRW
jgi:hypothetical protein